LNDAVLAYLEVERVAPAGTNRMWVIDGYSLSTHPDLCEHLERLNDAAGKAATFGYRFGRPVLEAAGVIVAFAAGTHIMCVRVPRGAVDARLLVEGRPDLGREWTRVDPFTVDVPRAEGHALLAALIRRAVDDVVSAT
jgi:hypothetical protein